MPMHRRSEIPAISPPTQFKVKFEEDAVADLRSRLQNARYAQDSLLPGASSFSIELHPRLPTLRKWAQDWESMDFQQFAKDLNQSDHFKTQIDWCNLHFIHRKSSRSDSIPLMLIHGWPGSFYEFHHIIDSLAEPNDPELPAFDVVCPSLPGFVFSSAPSNKESCGVDAYSRILNALMYGLGYERYAVQGGDWGSAHARTLAAKFQFDDGTGCRACHLNFCPCGPAENALTKLAGVLPINISLYLASWALTKDQLTAVAKSLRFGANNTAYYKIQQTRPAQLAPSLIDSPLGLLSYLGHFFTPSIGASETMTMEAVLRDISLYWFSGCIGTSFLPYSHNHYLVDIVKDPEYHIKVPLAYSGFPKEIADGPSAWIQNTGNLQWYAKSPRGGHFAAMEVPDLFLEHLQTCFSKKGRRTVARTDTGILEDGLMIKKGLWDEERERKAKAKL